MEGKTRFIIVSSMRCGTNYMRTLLNSHPEIECKGELLNKGLFPKINSLKDLDEEIWNKDKPVVGFKMFYSHTKCYPNVWEYILNEKIKVIHLKRRNQLDRFLSIKLARKHNYWHSSDEKDVYNKPVIIDPTEFRSATKEIHLMERKTDNMYRDAMKVDYEDIGKKLDCIQHFLGIKCMKLTSTSIKLTKSKRKLIVNYQEIKKLFPSYFNITFI